MLEEFAQIESTMKASSNELTSTEQNALKMALKYISERLLISDAYLNRRYGLSRCTLGKIRKGEMVTRCYDVYFKTFVRVLNNHRRLGTELCELPQSGEIDLLLRDLLLVHFGLPTDREIQRFEVLNKLNV